MQRCLVSLAACAIGLLCQVRAESSPDGNLQPGTNAPPPAAIPAVDAPRGRSPAMFPAPSLRDLRYGPHERNTLDIWKADTETPAPLLVLIHGGGWLKGDKQDWATNQHRRTIPFMLQNGISVASINYRYSTQAPLPAPVHDAARAIQFLRARAAELGIDKARIAATGGSAGGCTTLWLAVHDDLADPDAEDPVARESSRLCGAWANQAQTTIEPDVIRQSVSPRALKHAMIARAGGFGNDAELQAGYQAVAGLYREFSPINHLGADDPPILLSYNSGLDHDGGIHHARFGLIFKERADQVGAPCFLSMPGDAARFPGAPDPLGFLLHVLKDVPLPESGRRNDATP